MLHFLLYLNEKNFKKNFYIQNRKGPKKISYQNREPISMNHYPSIPGSARYSVTQTMKQRRAGQSRALLCGGRCNREIWGVVAAESKVKSYCLSCCLGDFEWG